MGFVGNYAPRGLAPQIDDMPVIPKKDSEGSPSLSLIFWLMSKLYYLDHKPALVLIQLLNRFY